MEQKKDPAFDAVNVYSDNAYSIAHNPSEVFWSAIYTFAYILLLFYRSPIVVQEIFLKMKTATYSIYQWTQRSLKIFLYACVTKTSLFLAEIFLKYTW